MGTGAAGWAPQIDVLASGRRVVAPSLPGYDDEPGPFSLRAACDRVRREIDAAPAGSRIVLCGLSLGALVVLQTACRAPRPIAALVVAAGFARLPDDLRRQQREMAAQVRGIPTSAFRTEVIDALAETVPVQYRADATASLRRFTPAPMADLMDEVAGFDVRADVEALTVPTLVLYGGADAANRPLCEDLAERIPGAWLTVVPGAGHVANLDAPEAFNRAVTVFLEGCGL